jgi:plastocyanin
VRSVLIVSMVGAGFLAGAALSAAEPQTLSIRMQKESFVPAQVAVAAGTRIVWTNNDTVPHSVTADDKRLDSGPILPGKSFEWTASGAGTIAYHCIFHPSMTAVLSVDDAAGKRARQVAGHNPKATQP